VTSLSFLRWLVSSQWNLRDRNRCRHFHHFRPEFNFINVKRTNFSYEMLFQQLFSSDMYIKKWRLYEKFVRLMLMKLTTEFNFTNILWPSFSYKNVLRSFSRITVLLWNFFGKIILVQKLFKKCWWNRLQRWISPTFYEELISTKAFCKAFICLFFGFVFFDNWKWA